MSPVRGISYFLIGFAALCWIGAAYVGITNIGSQTSANALSVLNMFNGIVMTSSLLAIALGIWLKD